MPGRCWSAGCPGRPPAARPPTSCSARPAPRDASPRPCRCGWNTPAYLSCPRGRARPLRQGHLRRLPRLRQARPPGRLPIRAWPVLHQLRLRRPHHQHHRQPPGQRLGRGGDLPGDQHRRPPRQGGRRARNRDPEASVARPVRELKAFAKVGLAPGETTVVEFTLAAHGLSLLVDKREQLGARGGRVRACVGASSATYGSPPRSTSPPSSAGRAGRHGHPPGMAGRSQQLRPAAQGGRNRRPGRDPRSWAAGSSWRSSATSPSAPWPPSPAWGSPTISSTAWSSGSRRGDGWRPRSHRGGSLSQTQGVGPVGLHTTSRGMSLIETTDAEPTRRRRLQKVVS